MNLPHISLTELSDGLALEIEGVELFDYVEDFLIEENNIEYLSFSVKEVDGVQKYTMLFSKHIKLETLCEALSQLSPARIEEIFRINCHSRAGGNPDRYE